MNILHSTSTGTASLLAAGSALAQSGNMMNGGMGDFGWMGGYGGIWVPILVVVLVAGLVAWAVAKKGK